MSNNEQQHEITFEALHAWSGVFIATVTLLIGIVSALIALEHRLAAIEYSVQATSKAVEKLTEERLRDAYPKTPTRKGQPSEPSH